MTATAQPAGSAAHRAPDDRATLLRWAEIDTAALRHNASAIRALLQPATQLMAMVKSNGYGHGAEIAARAALDGGATWLGVYTPDEALELRAAGLDGPMFVAGWCPWATHAALIRAGVDFSVFDIGTARSAAETAQSLGLRARVHVKIDTGLSRLGVRPEHLDELLRALASLPSLDVVGVLTHYADAEVDAEFTREQHKRFLEAAASVHTHWPEAMRHTAGSAAILNFPETHHELVRLGIALYGYGAPGHGTAVDLQPAMTVLARIAQVKTISAGETVGYGRTWRARARTRIATVAIGYGQAVPRALSNCGQFVVRGQRCAITGVVNMDQVSLDVSTVEHVEPGDVAMFFGRRDGVVLGADGVAAIAGTLPHEVMCGVSASVPRIAVDGSGHGLDGGRPTAVP